MQKYLIGGGILAFISFIILLILNPFTIVKTGHRGVVTQLGAVSDKVLDEGFHIISPLAASHDVDVRTQSYSAASAAASKDLQSVSATVVMNYNIVPANVVGLYKNVGMNYGETLVTPAIQDIVKAVTAQFTAEELITRRDEVSQQMMTLLAERLSAYFLVSQVSITNFDFSKSFNDSIELKVTAEQNALAAKNKLAEIEFLAQQTIVSAQADAESIRIQAQAITQQGGAEYVKLRAVEAWERGGSQVPTTYISDSGQSFILNLAQ